MIVHLSHLGIDYEVIINDGQIISINSIIATKLTTEFKNEIIDLLIHATI